MRWPQAWQSDSSGMSYLWDSVSTDAQDIVGIRHQATTDEELAVMNFNVCKLAIMLQFLVVMSYKR